MSSIDVNISALTAQRRRLDVIAKNIANAETTRTPKGGPYKRQQIIFSVGDVNGNEGVDASEIIEDPTPGKSLYRPGHPDADVNGFVEMPNVNTMEEMVDMVSATRSYEANISSIEAAKSMIRKALEIAR